MSEYCLHIDESGSSTPAYQPERPYILVGCAIATQRKAALKAKADELKKKYWGRTSIVFHHADIASNGKDFDIFRGNAESKKAFKDDLISFLRAAPIVAFVALVDKEHITATWKEETLVHKTTCAVYFNYISFLYSQKNPHGEIIIESATSEKDTYYLKELSYFLSPNCPEIDSDFTNLRNIKEVLCSITFVTKHNNDIETQIADIFGYAAFCLFKQQKKGKKFKKDSYEDKLIRVLKQKLFAIPPDIGPDKKRFFSKVDAFKYLPN